MQNFLTLPCYLLIFLSLFPALLYFVFFNFYYIITERSYLRTSSFYFKIYYLIKYVQKISNIKNRTNSSISFFHPPPKNRTSTHIISENQMSIHIISVSFVKTHHLKQCIKKRPLPEASSLIFVLNLTLQFIYSTLDSQSSHPHKLARDYSLSNNAASAQYPPPILLANGQSDTYSTPYDLRDKHLTV